MTNTVAVSTTKSTKRNRTYIAPNRNEVLFALFSATGDNGKRVPQTGAQISAFTGLVIESPYLLLLEKQGLISRRGVVKGQVGRPPVLWALSDKGVKRIKRAIA